MNDVAFSDFKPFGLHIFSLVDVPHLACQLEFDQELFYFVGL